MTWNFPLILRSVSLNFAQVSHFYENFMWFCENEKFIILFLRDNFHVISWYPTKTKWNKTQAKHYGSLAVVLFRKNMILMPFFFFVWQQQKTKTSQFILGCKTFSQTLKPVSTRNIKEAFQYNKWPLVKTLFMHLFTTPASQLHSGSLGGMGHPGQVGSLLPFYPDPLYRSLNQNQWSAV